MWRIKSCTSPISSSTEQIDIAYAESLAQYPRLRHGVTLREALSKPFNLSFSTAEDWEEIRHNRGIACNLLGFDVSDLVMPAQVHGAEVAVVGPEHRGAGALSPDTAIAGCDALVTVAPGLLLGITIADCLPVFFFDPIHNAIGLAHSGWRGTAGRIAIRTLQAMTSAFGSRPSDCLIAIGPGIGPEAYEVDTVVHDAFTPNDAAAPGVFAATVPGHWALDLTAAVVYQLTTFDVPRAQISVSPWRTHRDTTLFFSHRLSPGCPRMGAFIGLRPL